MNTDKPEHLLTEGVEIIAGLRKVKGDKFTNMVVIMKDMATISECAHEFAKRLIERANDPIEMAIVVQQAHAMDTLVAHVLRDYIKLTGMSEAEIKEAQEQVKVLDRYTDEISDAIIERAERGAPGAEGTAADPGRG